MTLLERLSQMTAAAVVGVTVALGGAAPAAAQDDRPELVIAVDNLWRTLEPMIGFSSSAYRFNLNIFDPLVDRNYLEDPEGTGYVPSIATGWERTSPTVWEFSIRQDVLFHDGRELTAEDVAFTLSAERMWGPESLARRGRSFMRNTVRVEATGPHTVEIETAFPDPVYYRRFTDQIGMVVPADFAGMTPEEYGMMPIGTGPYRVTEFNPGDRLVMEAFDEGWRGAPPASRITWVIVPEPSARLAGLVSGEYDFIVNVPPDQQEVFDAYDDITLVVRSIANYPMFAMNTLVTEENPDNPLVDARLRQAIVSGVDRDLITEALWGDATFVPTPFNFPEYGDFYFDPERDRMWPYDPERARQLVEESGYDGTPLIWKITRGFYPNYEAAAEIMVEMWAEVGIDVQLAIVDNFSLAYERPFHLLNMSMGSAFSGDPMRPLWIDWGPGSNRVGAHHRTWVPTDRFLELGRAFEREEDLERRRALYLDLVEEWETVTPGMYMWRNVLIWAHRADYDWVSQPNSGMRLYGDYLTVN